MIPHAPALPTREPELPDAKRIKIARRIWRDVKPATATTVERISLTLLLVNASLALAEGIETALIVQQATGNATCAALGAANFARIELPDWFAT
jgi:hypothetical protein